MEHTKTKGCLDSLTLKLLAMALMLCDHLWATVLHLLGVDHERLTYRFSGRDYRLSDVHGQVVRELLA